MLNNIFYTTVSSLVFVLIAERGAMYVFNGGQEFPIGDVTANCGLNAVEPCPGKKVFGLLLFTLLLM